MKKWTLCKMDCFFCCVCYTWNLVCDQETYDKCMQIDVTSLIKAIKEHNEAAHRGATGFLVSAESSLKDLEDGVI